MEEPPSLGSAESVVPTVSRYPVLRYFRINIMQLIMMITFPDGGTQTSQGRKY
jgi:hypothetical protein